MKNEAVGELETARFIKARNRHFSDFGWLKTYWLFSFSDYYDPWNIQFGALRVFNDDVVEAGMGFPTHPHQEMEIITIVLAGEMTHEDSMGNKAVIKAGDVQRMSAGTGLTHSEFNRARKPVHFYQVWIYPDDKGLQPSYDQRSFDSTAWANKLCPIASGQGLKGAVTFHTNATIYRAALDAGKTLKHKADSSRRIFVYVTSGAVEVDGTLVEKEDQARIDPHDGVELTAKEASELILIDVPSCRGWGYDEQTLKGAKK